MGIPFALSKAGLIPGVLLLIVVAIISDWSVYIMIKSGRLVNATSYQDMMRKAFGPVGAALSALFQVMFALGCLCIYQLIIAENLTRVIRHYLPASLLAERSLLILAGNLFIILPLSLARDVTLLGKIASLSVGGNILIALAVLFQRNTESFAQYDASFRYFAPSFIDSIGIISFSFVCHHNTFLLRESLESKSSRLFSVVTSISVGFSLLVSLLLSIPAYIHFGAATDANILNNFSDGNSVINYCRILFAVSLYASYPLDCFVARDVLTRSVFPKTSSIKPKATHTFITMAVVAFTTGVALLFEDLGQVLELTGGVSATALAFLFPSAAYLRLYPKSPTNRANRIAAALLFMTGLGILLQACSKPLKAFIWPG